MSRVNQTSEELLLRYAAGKLRPAPALVVASHLALSPSSRRLVSGFESIGGGLLESEPSADLSPGLLERTLGRLDDTPALRPQTPAPNHEALQMGIGLPAPLSERTIRPWRWLGPSLRCARVEMAEDPDHKLVLLRGQPRVALPGHGHTGEELSLVIKGAFHDEAGRHDVGDLIHEDQNSDHKPVVTDDGECICLLAIEGRMRFKNWLVRMAQPWIGL
jgi:putative transcriptional regulator